MCGIFGCVSREDVVPRILQGLKRLEYRGYDSAGVACVDDRGALSLTRRVGKLDNLLTALKDHPVHGRTGIGHTRWATHGAPSESNAHPHTGTSGTLAVVHNGIIENHDILRAELKAAGCVFRSETDSEVIAHLVEHHYRGDLVAAVRAAVGRLEGSYAIVAVDSRHPDVLVAARQDSPLVVGLGQPELYLSSDIPALLEFTRDVMFIEDQEVVCFQNGAVTIFGPEGEEKNRAVQHIDWGGDSEEELQHEHFMLKEIEEQPRKVRSNIALRVPPQRVSGTAPLAADHLPPDLLSGIDSITIIACGTSWHAGLVAKFWIESWARVPVEVDLSSEFRYRDLLIDDRHLIVPISQSGETADTLAALRESKRLGARSLAVCNVVGSTMSREAGGVLYTHAGPEIGVASTKAFTTQLVALRLLALELAAQRGTRSSAEIDAALTELTLLPDQLEATLTETEKVREIASRYAGASDFLFLGRGVNYPIALEGALKLKEISYIHAEGYPAGEMKHGPIALIDDDLPVVVIATPGRVYEKVLSNIEESRARGGKVIAVALPDDRRVAALADAVLPVAEVSEEVSPIVNVLPLQLLAYHIAHQLGRDIDKPRNLAKSVTVE
ncbi:MAG: glutamine--fructose-6-phosphate transaminase (isomerizing) [Planctomycetota bacterium]